MLEQTIELNKYLIKDITNIIMEYTAIHCENCNNKIWKDKFEECRNNYHDCYVICGKCNYILRSSIKSSEKRRDWGGYICSLCKNPSKGSIKKRKNECIKNVLKK